MSCMRLYMHMYYFNGFHCGNTVLYARYYRPGNIRIILTILMTAYSKKTCLTFSVHCNQILSFKSSAHLYSESEL